MPEAPEHCNTIVSEVESWPSTLIRLNERCVATFSKSAASSASSAASVCTNTSNVAKCGEIMPAPFASTAMRTLPADSSTSSSTCFGKASVVRIAAAKSSAPSRRSCGPSFRMPCLDHVHRQRHTDHAGRRDRDQLGLDAGQLSRGGAHPRRVEQPLLARGGVGVAGVHDDRPQRADVRLLAG